MNEHEIDRIASAFHILPDETWVPLPGYEATYRISTLGRVYSIPRPTTSGGILRHSPDNYGYPRVSLVQNGKQRKVRVHLLVARTFLGEPEGDRTEVRHLNGDPTDPSLMNLAYGTHSENMFDMSRHGRGNAAKTHCPRGHEYAGANLLVSGGRRCRTCIRDRQRGKR